MDPKQMMRPFEEIATSYKSMEDQVAQIRQEVSAIYQAMDLDINKSQLADLMGISRNTLYKRIAEGEVPFPITLRMAIELKKNARQG